MLTSVKREIPDDSIEGTKIKDNTDVDYFGTTKQKYLNIITSGGNVRGQLSTLTDAGELHLWNGSSKNLYLNADETQVSYVDRYLLIKGTSTTVNTTTYPFQILSGGIWAENTISGQILHIRDSSNNNRVTLNTFSGDGSAFIFNSSGISRVYLSAKTGQYSYINSILIFGGTTPSSSYPVGTWPTQSRTNFAVEGAISCTGDLTANNVASNINLITSTIITNSLQNLTGQTISPTRWSYLASLNQGLDTLESPSFQDISLYTTITLEGNLKDTIKVTSPGSNPLDGKLSSASGTRGTPSASQIKYKQFGSSGNATFSCQLKVDTSQTSTTTSTLRIDISTYISGTTVEWSGFVNVFDEDGSSPIPSWGSFNASGRITIRRIDGSDYSGTTNYTCDMNITGPVI